MTFNVFFRAFCPLSIFKQSFVMTHHRTNLNYWRWLPPPRQHASPLCERPLVWGPYFCARLGGGLDHVSVSPEATKTSALRLETTNVCSVARWCANLISNGVLQIASTVKVINAFVEQYCRLLWTFLQMNVSKHEQIYFKYVLFIFYC